MSLRAPDTPDLGFQVGDHVCAFYNGGNSLNDIVVDYLSKGLQAGNKCVCIVDNTFSVEDRIPADLKSRDDILQFITQEEAYLSGGHFSKDAFRGKLEAMVREALAGGYDRFWVLGDVSFVIQHAIDPKTWFAYEAEVNEFAPRYPQFIMCLYNLDLFDGEMVMYVLQTHPRVFVNGLVITNSHYIPPRQFLASL